MITNPLLFAKQHTEYLKNLYSLCPPDHGWGHIVDVVWNARSICVANNIPYTKEIEWGAILHDIGNRVSRDNHHIISAKMAYDILSELNVDDVDHELVAQCCRYHRASEKEDITNKSVDVQVVAAADRGRGYSNFEDIMEHVIWRAIQYSMTHTEEVDDPEDPVYSGWKWCVDTYTSDNARTKYYSELYRNAFGQQLKLMCNVIKDITLDEVREWCKREKGIGADITIS